jgi:uncharacterized integral membrane protein
VRTTRTWSTIARLEEQPKGADRKARRGLAGFSWKTVALVALGIYAVILIFVNSQRVKLDFVFFHAQTRLIFLVVLSMALGALVMWLFPRFRRRGRGH